MIYFVQTIEITPTQSISIFGWWDQPRTILTWDDIKLKKLTWRKLRNLNFNASDLQHIQGAKEEWIKRGGLTLNDVSDMTAFPVNPFTDMHADLGEVWSMKWTPEQMTAMGITYNDLLRKGLNIEIMAHFNMPLSSWVLLGFCQDNIVQGHMSERVFGMDEDELRRIIADYH